MTAEERPTGVGPDSGDRRREVCSKPAGPTAGLRLAYTPRTRRRMRASESAVGAPWGEADGALSQGRANTNAERWLTSLGGG
ncbi:hypothetical protein B296_00031688 [Ensete ventricosum]|uniref:Uncharacterized protein n=1 Tax=Ensete ventricosum TaxID=4639 RepID=A0A426YC49_ENSVE|nr:hypothetical protein B296_00031688 [Ensete ventricosum]